MVEYIATTFGPHLHVIEAWSVHAEHDLQAATLFMDRLIRSATHAHIAKLARPNRLVMDLMLKPLGEDTTP